MRLDKFISQATTYSRSQAKKLISNRRVKINNEIIKDASFNVSTDDQVLLDNATLTLTGPRYFILHKPAGYICSTVDDEYPSALKLLDLDKKSKLHFAGRLDQDTTGLVLISDDGDWTHRVTSPKKSCSKTYRVWLKVAIEQEAIAQLQSGVQLKNETRLTKPAKLEVINAKEVLLTITEGKYHQVKRMFAAVNNRVVKLHRENIGLMNLSGLEEGQWRELTKSEVASI